MAAYRYRDKRKLDYATGILFGIRPEQEAEAEAAIRYWEDCQLNNLVEKSTAYTEYCHKQIMKIKDWIRRNTYE